MKRLLFLLAALAISLPLFSQEYIGDSCTALMVGKKASSDGSVMTSHTCDGRYRTWVQTEPDADHEPDAMHPVLLNAYTEYIYNESVRTWQALEDKYWLQFGMGF